MEHYGWVDSYSSFLVCKLSFLKMYVSLLSETQFKENKIEKLITRQNLVENVIGISLPVTGELTEDLQC